MQNQLTTIIAIPARLKSSRLPNKVLADINGKPMIQHVLERCSLAKTPEEIVLCTDSQQLQGLANELGFNAILTSPDCQSGSERIASVCNQLIKLSLGKINNTESQKNIDPKDFLIINVQGDQPFINPNVIDEMSKEFCIRNQRPEVLTPIYELDYKKIHNPNIVKTLIAKNGKAIYFSRSALPHVRGYDQNEWHKHTKYWGHVGIYGYRADILMKWADLPNSPLEEIEKLEQLKLIEAGIEIGTFNVNEESLSVDTADQLEQAREMALLQ